MVRIMAAAALSALRRARRGLVAISSRGAAATATATATGHAGFESSGIGTLTVYFGHWLAQFGIPRSRVVRVAIT